MTKFTNLLERSKAITRFAQVERLTQDQVYELFFECFVSYGEIFIERLKHGQHLRHVISSYKHIPEFKVLRPSDIHRIVFTSRKMAYWFAFQWWMAIDKQVSEKRIDKSELIIETMFMGRIPSAITMEEILYEQKPKKGSKDLLLPEGQISKPSATEVGARVAVNS
jgi:hypothetical protein